MKILVTGAAGFIGFHLVERLCKEGHDVVGIDNINDYYDVNLKYARLFKSGIERTEIEDNILLLSKKYASYRFMKLDLTDRDNLEHLFKKEQFSHVVNLAAQAGVRYSIENPHAYVQSNLVGFVNILECCRHNDIKHLVYASSSSVYGNSEKVPFSETDNVDKPISLYAATKKSNELMAHTYSHLYNLQTTGLRFFTVYGPYGRPDMAPILFATLIRNKQAIKVFNNGEMERDFTYIDDIVEGILRICKVENNDNPPYKIMNIGNGSPVKLMEFISTLEKYIGLKAEKIFMPMQDGDVKRTWADTKFLKDTVGYTPSISIDSGVKKFVNWFNKYIDER
jgi:UDP-glucuronate 4-epimerase